jgi:hypothetical protein
MLTGLPFTVKRALFVLACVAALAALAGGYGFFRAALQPLEQGTAVSFSASGVSEQFVIAGRNLVPAPGLPFSTEGLSVIEAVPSPAPGELIALARTGDSIVLGVIRADTSFEPLVNDRFAKAGLVSSEHAVAFSVAHTPPAHGGAAIAQEVARVETGEEGYRVHILGEGRSPRFLPDGSLLFLSRQGVVRVADGNAERTVVILRFGADAAGSAISADASRIVIADPARKALAFYARDSQEPLSYAFQGMILDILPTDAAFVGSEEVLVRLSEDRAALYRAPTVAQPFPHQTAVYTIRD